MKHAVFVIALALFSSVSIAQKVNYSGEWKLNEDKSQLGHRYSLAPASISIKHKRKVLEMQLVHVWDGQNLLSVQRYTLDGKECVNVGFEESVTKSTARMDRGTKTIKIITHGSAEGMDYSFTQDMSLKDGQLVVDAEAASDLGEMAETYIYDKQ